MYKELSSDLKSYTPTDLELEYITDNFLKHSFKFSGNNLFGEMYEAWVYEYLKAWAISNPLVTTYVSKNKTGKTGLYNGLDYDKNGQIIYLKDGRKAAEYDGLFIYNGKVVIVESSVSELRSYYRNIEDKLILKRELLVSYFNTEEVYYLMVTRPGKKSLVYRSLPHLILYKLKNPVFDTLKGSTRVYSSLDSQMESHKIQNLKAISYP